MSYGEQIALRGHANLETVASAAEIDLRSPSEDQFLEKLRRGDALAYERLVAEHSFVSATYTALGFALKAVGVIVLFTGDPNVGDRVRSDDDVVHLVKGEMSVADVVATIRRLGGDPGPGAGGHPGDGV